MSVSLEYTSQAGVDPGFFLEGGEPLRNGVTELLLLLLFQNTSYIRKPHVIWGGGGVYTPTPYT